MEKTTVALQNCSEITPVAPPELSTSITSAVEIRDSLNFDEGPIVQTLPVVEEKEHCNRKNETV